MTITPSWKKEEPGKSPPGLPHAPAPNLSDLDETQPSLRMQGAERALPPSGAMSFNPVANANPQPRPQHSEPEDTLVGTMFADRYEVLEMLGRGGMGAVYKARNRINKNFRALKMMHAHLVADPQVFRRFQQEATAAARINHPNAITIIDMGMAPDGRPYLVMDFLDGISLSELLKYKKKLSIKEALHIFIQMCGALTEAHSHGVIHRDIKPSNVMILDGVNSQYLVKVVDFGIAKVFPQEGDPTMKDTTTGELFGSPPYMSPEQCLGKRLDYRSDIYSMGCLMYEVLTGAPPLVGQNALGTMYRQINEMPTPLADINDDVRLIQRLDEIISKTLQKNPDNRYQTIAELQADLESAGEWSTKKVRAISAIGMKVQAFQRAFSNSLGSAKRLVVTLMVMSLLLFVGGVFVVAPYVLSKEPTGPERVISWQAVPALAVLGDGGFVAAESDKRGGVKIAEGEAPSSFEFDSHLYQAITGLADFYFANNKTASALVQYQRVRNLGLAMFRANKLSDSEKTSLIPSLTQLLVRLTECKFSASPGLTREPAVNIPPDLAKLNPYPKPASEDPNDSIALANYTNNLIKDAPNNLDHILLCSVIAFEATQGHPQAAQASQASQGFFEQAIVYFEKNGITHDQAELIAPMLSAIGDFYAAKNDPAATTTALRAYKLAEASWTLMENRGRNNAAVTEERMGQMQLRLGNKPDAIELFSKAADTFELASRVKSLDCAKANFDAADALWSNGQYLQAIRKHTEAARIWSAKRTSN